MHALFVLSVMSSLKAQLRQISKTAQERLVKEQKRLKELTELSQLERARKSAHWEICENNIWEKLQRNLMSAANEGHQSYTYLVRSEDLKGHVDVVYSRDLETLRECLISYVRSKGLECEPQYIYGNNYGRHLEIKW